MKLTERDKLLAMFVPAIIVVAVYGLFFLRGKIAERTRVEKSLADVRAKAPSHAQIAEKRSERVKLMQETEAINGKLKALQQRWTYETEFCVTGARRHDRVEKLTNLLTKHDLTSMEDTEVESSNKDAKANAALESVVQKIAQMSSTQKPQLRRIRFHGRFESVQRALDELTTGQVLAIPVGLTMKRTDDPDRREWTLLVWL
jgi:hypothetical protein